MGLTVTLPGTRDQWQSHTLLHPSRRSHCGFAKDNVESAQFFLCALFCCADYNFCRNIGARIERNGGSSVIRREAPESILGQDMVVGGSSWGRGTVLRTNKVKH